MRSLYLNRETLREDLSEPQITAALILFFRRRGWF